jgi:deoxyribodipyrimidine photo-lyase
LNRFKENALLDFSRKVDNTTIVKSKEFPEAIGNTKKFDVIYPGVGENKDFLTDLAQEHGLELSFLTREADLFAWQFANKGFFNFKKNIVHIINEI